MRESKKVVAANIVRKILDDVFKPSEFSGAPFVFDRYGQRQTIFCGSLPHLAYGEVEKLYWQNDIDQVNNLIDIAMARDDIVPRTYRFAKDSFVLRDFGIKIPKSPENIDITSVRTHDVVFAIDEEGDLVRATVA